MKALGPLFRAFLPLVLALPSSAWAASDAPGRARANARSERIRGARPLHQSRSARDFRASAPFRSQTIEIAGERLQVFERRNGKGAVVGQTIFGPRFRVFWIDADGDGRMEHWEASDSQGTVSLRGPKGAKFAFMDVEQSRRDGRVQMKFVYSSRSGDYVLYDARRVPHRTMLASQSFIVGCRGTPEDQRLRDLAIRLNQRLKEDGSSAALRQAIEQMVGEGCADPAFESSRQQIVNGLLAVATSDVEYTNAQARRADNKSNKYQKTGMYLQCLRDFNLDVLASRIGASFAQTLNLDSDRDVRPWKLSCEVAPTDREHGAFDSQSGTIRLFDTRESIANARGLGSGELDRALEGQYASTAFHEKLHEALIEDERIVDAIQSCCGTNARDDSKECDDLRNLVEWKEMGQRFESAVVSAMENDPAAPSGGYALMRDGLRQAFGPKADQMIEGFYLNVGRAYQEFGDRSECHRDGSKTALGTCEAAFRGQLVRDMQAFFGDDGGQGGRCVQEATSAFSDAQKAKSFCDTFHRLSARLLDVPLQNAAGASACAQLTSSILPALSPSGGFALLEMLLRSPVAFAGIEEGTRTFCSLVDKVRPIELNFSPVGDGPPAPPSVELRSVASPVSQAQGAQAAGQSAVVSGSAPTQTSFPSAPFSSAPSSGSRALLARDPAAATRRQEQFLQYLSGSSSALERTRTLAEAVSRSLVPEAAAESRRVAGSSSASSTRSGRSGREAGREDGRGSRAVDGPAGSDFASYAANLPKLRLADPLAPARSVASAGSTAALNGTGFPAAASAGVAPERSSAAAGAAAATASSSSSASGRTLSAGSPASSTSFPSGGSGAAVSRSPSSPAHSSAAHRKRRHDAFQALLRALLGPYEAIKPQLSRLNLGAFGVQAIDDDEQVYGSARPTCTVRYDRSLGRLAADPQCRARDP